jgi:hypothetical protein
MTQLGSISRGTMDACSTKSPAQQRLSAVLDVANSVCCKRIKNFTKIAVLTHAA